MSYSFFCSANNGSMAQKLTKRLNKQVLLSFNVPTDEMNKPIVENAVIQRIIEELG